MALPKRPPLLLAPNAGVVDPNKLPPPPKTDLSDNIIEYQTAGSHVRAVTPCGGYRIIDIQARQRYCN